MKIDLACQQLSHNRSRQGARIYCTECRMSVSVSAKHIFDILQTACIHTCKHISYPVGNRFTQPTQSVVLNGGVFFCTACGATAKNKLVKLFEPCFPCRHEPNYNLKAYKKGRAPAWFPTWPYKHITTCQTIVLSSVRASVDRLEVVQREQFQVVSSEEEWPESGDSGLSTPDPFDPFLSGSSESEG